MILKVTIWNFEKISNINFYRKIFYTTFVSTVKNKICINIHVKVVGSYRQAS